MVWIETDSRAVFVENRIHEHRRLEVRADVANITTPPPSQVVTQDGASDSKLENTTLKEQGKVYRTDRYTIHWRTHGECRPLRTQLRVSGAIEFAGACLPPEGQIGLSRNYLLEPPRYEPSGPDHVEATVTVTDCAGHSRSCTNRVERP